MNGRRFLARAWRALASLRAAGVAARRAIALIVAASLATARAQGQGTNWSSPSGDAGAMRWSPLTQVNTGNVARLVPAWTWKTGEKAIPAGPNQKPARPGQLQVSPVVINDTMYLSTSYAAVAALEAATGKLIWRYDPEVWRAGQPSNGTGFVHRGISTWSDGRERRVFINARWRLVALDARTGKPIPAFGRNGEINLLDGLRRKVNPLHYTNTSPSLVVGDLVIVGNGVGDRLRYPNDPPGDVQAFDVRTGKRAWSFHTIPDSGEFGWQTWEKGSWKYMGHTNVWAPMSADTARGLVFLPVSTPTNDWYGGDRLGDNLFAEAVVALDAKTGVRRWHFQTVHHGLWDYDLPAPPIMAQRKNGAAMQDVVVVPAKTGWLYIFDRVTGKPVWPIEEKPVPQSDVAGERTSKTQPMPTWPAPFSRQGLTEADLMDLTPELKREALAVFRKYRSGPVFTPPSVQGTIAMPGVIGGAGWGSTSFDPETRTVYVKATESPALFKVVTGEPNDTIGYRTTIDLRASDIGVKADPDSMKGDHTPPEALPIIKPPYGTLTAIDLDSGKPRWKVVLGDTPAIRNHPLLKGKLSGPVGVAGAPGGTVTRGGLIFITGGGDVLYALDKATGKVLWQAALPAGRGYANPVTYATRDGRQYVVIASGAGEKCELVAFALPR